MKGGNNFLKMFLDFEDIKRTVVRGRFDADNSPFYGIADKIDPQIGTDFSVRLRQQTGRIAGLCGGFANEKRAKKMR